MYRYFGKFICLSSKTDVTHELGLSCLPECSMLIQGTPKALNRHHNLLAHFVSRAQKICPSHCKYLRKQEDITVIYFVSKGKNCLNLTRMFNY